jgi:hypothetical protein
MSGEMTSQQTLYSFSEILYNMKPVCALKSLWSASSRRSCIFASAIPTDCHQIRMLAHPGGCGVCFPIS